MPFESPGRGILLCIWRITWFWCLIKISCKNLIFKEPFDTENCTKKTLWIALLTQDIFTLEGLSKQKLKVSVKKFKVNKKINFLKFQSQTADNWLDFKDNLHSQCIGNWLSFLSTLRAQSSFFIYTEYPISGIPEFQFIGMASLHCEFLTK